MASYEIEQIRAYLRDLTGSVLLFAGAPAPDWFLPCDGAAVSRERFPDLFAAIGTTYGAGDGSTTFNVPSLPAYSGMSWFIVS